MEQGVFITFCNPLAVKIIKGRKTSCSLPGTTSNPYVYSVVPCKEQEVFLPLMILTARGLQKVMERENMLTKEEKDALDTVLLTAEKLLAGHPVGPGRMGSSSSKESS